VIKRRRGPVMTFECEITVDGKRVAEAELLAQLSGEFSGASS
jgi:3-hydroxymyristoyl/3-hydroxydecanoyl-(acyl carrier protein) dehydratase